MVPATATQFAAEVMVWKLSGYAQSVKGHGRQQVSSSLSFWQILPSTTGAQLLAHVAFLGRPYSVSSTYTRRL